jgi:hypothetical protein
MTEIEPITKEFHENRKHRNINEHIWFDGFTGDCELCGHESYLIDKVCFSCGCENLLGRERFGGNIREYDESFPNNHFIQLNYMIGPADQGRVPMQWNCVLCHEVAHAWVTLDYNAPDRSIAGNQDFDPTYCLECLNSRSFEVLRNAMKLAHYIGGPIPKNFWCL